MNNLDKKIDREISFLELKQIFINNIVFIIITTLTFLLLSTIYAFFVAIPDYKSNADVMVQVEQDPMSSDQSYDLVNAFRLIDTIAELMEKEIVLKNAINRLEILGYENLDINDIREGLQISSSSTSYFINVSFIDQDEQLAMDAVDSVIEAVIEETDVEDAFPVLTDKIRRTSFASEAVYNSPNKLVFIFVGVFLGLAISSIFSFSKELLSSNFKSKDEIESEIGLQVLGIIPYMNKKGIKKNEKKAKK